MTPQPQQDRCVLTRHDVQSIKDLVFVVGSNSESSAQKTIFEILANNMRRSRPAPSPEELREAYQNGYIDGQAKAAIENERCIEGHRKEASAQARKELFEAIKAERDPHLDYVDWDSIEAAYSRTGGEPR